MRIRRFIQICMVTTFSTALVGYLAPSATAGEDQRVREVARAERKQAATLKDAVRLGRLASDLVGDLATDGSAVGIVSFAEVVTGPSRIPASAHSALRATRSTLAATKSVAFAVEGADVVNDLDVLHTTVMRFSTPESLLDVVNAPNVVSVASSGRESLFTEESIPMIHADATAAAGNDGRGTYVAVIDSGVDYTRQAFGCTAPASPASCRVAGAYEYAADDGMMDDNGHGTNVAGIVAAVAPGTKILAFDVFDGEFANDVDETGAGLSIIDALRQIVAWKVQGWNIRAVNLSLGWHGSFSTTDCSQKPNDDDINLWNGGPNPYVTVFADLLNNQILPVVASGNDADDQPGRQGISYPACTPGAVSVGAVQDGGPVADYFWGGCTDLFYGTRDAVTDFSQTGPNLTVLAPGECIEAADVGMAGTSQAAPHVAGAVAVLAGARPTATAAQIKAAIAGTGPEVRDTRYGFDVTKRRLDVQAALQALPSSDLTPPTVVAPVQTITGQIGSTVPVTIGWSATDSSGVAAYELWASTNGATFVRQTLPSATTTSITYLLTPGTSYRFFVRAMDAVGNWSSLTLASSFGPTYTPQVVDDRSSAITYAKAPGSTTSTWKAVAWTLAYQGTITTGTKAGEYARYTFTGRNVAWAGSVGTTRGVANVFIDGTLYKSVDLFSATGAGARVVVEKRWTSTGTHTIDVQVVGTAGRPTIDIDAFVVLK